MLASHARTVAKGNEEKMRRVVAAGVAIFGMLVLVPCAGAITYGVPDSNGHPEVGALLAQQAFSDGTWEECSGTLIAPRLFLTAAHCDEGVSRVAATARTRRFPRPSRRSGWSC
jgi:hypothetical protein